MKTKQTRSRRLRAIPNNKKLRELQLYEKYRKHEKKVTKKRLEKLAISRLGL